MCLDFVCERLDFLLYPFLSALHEGLATLDSCGKGKCLRGGDRVGKIWAVGSHLASVAVGGGNRARPHDLRFAPADSVYADGDSLPRVAGGALR